MCYLSLQSAALVWPLRLAPEISEQSKWNPVIVTHYPATDGHYTHVMGVIVPVLSTVHALQVTTHPTRDMITWLAQSPSHSGPGREIEKRWKLKIEIGTGPGKIGSS